MSDGIRHSFIGTIKIDGEIYVTDNHRLTEPALEAMAVELAQAIMKHTGIQAHIGFSFTKCIGTKVNS